MELAEKIRRVRQGDQAALNDVIRTYGADVYQRALTRTGSREAAKETTRQVISELIETLKRCPDADGYELWLRALTDKTLLARTEAETEAARIGREFHAGEEAPTKGAEEEVPVYTPRRARGERASLPPLRAPEPEEALAFAPRPGREAVSDCEIPGGASEREPAAARRQMDAEEATADARDAEALRREEAFLRDQRRYARARQARGQGNERDQEPKLSFKEPRRGANGFVVFFLSVVCLALTWFAVGLMMRLGWIPAVDLGYVWFNQNVYLLF